MYPSPSSPQGMSLVCPSVVCLFVVQYHSHNADTGTAHRAYSGFTGSTHTHCEPSEQPTGVVSSSSLGPRLGERGSENLSSSLLTQPRTARRDQMHALHPSPPCLLGAIANLALLVFSYR